MIGKPGGTESTSQRLLDGVGRDLPCPVQRGPSSAGPCWSTAGSGGALLCQWHGHLGNSFLLSPWSVLSGS